MDIFQLQKKFGPAFFEKTFPKSFPVRGSICDISFAKDGEQRLLAASQHRSALQAVEDSEEEFLGPASYEHLWPRWAECALHEGGHAVVAYVLGWTPAFVSVDTGPMGKGANRYESAEEEDFHERLPAEILPAYFAAEMAMKAGGIAAQAILWPEKLKHALALHDVREARDIAFKMLREDGTEPEPSVAYCAALERKLEEASETACRIVAANRTAVLEAACLVLREGIIEGNEVCSLFERHGVARENVLWRDLVLSS